MLDLNAPGRGVANRLQREMEMNANTQMERQSIIGRHLYPALIVASMLVTLTVAACGAQGTDRGAADVADDTDVTLSGVPATAPRTELVLATAVSAGDSSVVQAVVPDTREQVLFSLAPMLEEVTPAVVNISVEVSVADAGHPALRDPNFRRFFGIPDGAVPPQARMSAGSGVIVDATNGFILTNDHVVRDADRVVVTLRDRRTYTAKLIGSDPQTDIAVLQIDADDLTAMPLAAPGSVQVGDIAVAIGNPFGLGQTVTMGIVSGLGRSGLIENGYEDFIQTDASINPGNSGGALVNSRGELIGVNSAILSRSGGNIGIGFAVPMHIAGGVMEQLVAFGEVRRGQLGVTIQDATPEIAEAVGAPTAEGAVVVQVLRGSAADRSGLRSGDLIVAINGDPVSTSSELRSRVGVVPVGEEVSITVYRDGEQSTIISEVGS